VRKKTQAECKFIWRTSNIRRSCRLATCRSLFYSIHCKLFVYKKIEVQTHLTPLIESRNYLFASVKTCVHDVIKEW